MVRKGFITQRISEVFLKPWDPKSKQETPGIPPSLRMSQMRISRHVGLLRPTNHGMTGMMEWGIPAVETYT